MMRRRELLRMAAGLAIAPAALDTPRQRRPLPKGEFDYVDWSWARWREITRQVRPSVSAPQAGHAELLDLVDPAKAVATARGWSERQRTIRATVSVFLGQPSAPAAPLVSEMLEESVEASHVRHRIRFSAATGEWIPAYLLVPRRSRRGAPMPAILCPHQTTQEGKREPAGIAGNPEQAIALHLVERGFVALTWDTICFGERHDPASGHYGDAIPFYTAHPDWSLLAKMIADLSRAVDYLSTLDFVDVSRIGCAGHSHGGITTIVGMALEPRLAAGASNCGFDTFRIDGNVWRWSHATALIPRLGFYASSPYLSMDRYRAVPDSEVIQVPFDLHEVLALAAPRPLLLSTSDEDFVFPNAGWSVRMSLPHVKAVYAALGAPDRLRATFFSGGHRLPPAVAREMYEWLERTLKPA